jgi:hypothetical protein
MSHDMADGSRHDRVHQDHAGQDWGGQVLAALDKQRDLLTELTTLAERQGTLIDGGRGEALLDLLAERQRVVDGFAGADGELGRLLAELPTRLPTLAADRRRAVTEAALEIERQLTHLNELDDADRRRLETTRDKTRSQLAAIDTGRQANQAYRVAEGSTNRFADERG